MLNCLYLDENKNMDVDPHPNPNKKRKMPGLIALSY
jgi:hypothetical protein